MLCKQDNWRRVDVNRLSFLKESEQINGLGADFTA
jgi:hypothetical protein